MSFLPNNCQNSILNNFKNFRRVIFKKSRQIGMTNTMCFFAATEAIAEIKNIGIFVTSHGLRAHGIKNLLKNIPDELIGFIGKDVVYLSNGSRISLLPFHEIQKANYQFFDIVFLDEFIFANSNIIHQILPFTKRLIASSSARENQDFDLGLESLKIIDSCDIEVFSSKKFSFIGVK